MSIWNLLFSDEPDDSKGDSISISMRTPAGYEGGRSRGGCSIPKNMAGCIFYLFLLGLAVWVMTDYSDSFHEPRRVRVCASASIWPWDSCR